MKFLSRKISPYLVLFVLIFLGFWQIALLQESFKWDLIDVVFPFRYFFSECIHSGYFPFWNPYLQTGYPFYADLQAPVFYPELLFTSIFSGYGIYTMHFWFIAYVLIASAGMYQLSYYFNKNTVVSLFAGFAYAFSGYIVGHGQHFFLLVGAAWIPFVLVNYLKLCYEKKIVNALKTAVFVFLMVTGAYQALSFTLLYFLLVLFVFFTLKELLQKNYYGFKQLVKLNMLLFFIVIIFSLPLIVSTFEIITSVERLQTGIGLSETKKFGLNFNSLISFLLPFSTTRNPGFFNGADVSMRNHYFGMIPFLFFLVALFKKQTKLEYLILGCGAIIFASSFAALPVREFMFKHVPLMNLFKYAAYLNIFGLLAFILLASNYFAKFLENIQKEKQYVTYIVTVIMIFLVFSGIYSLKNLSFPELKTGLHFPELFQGKTFYHRILYQSIIQLSILIVFLVSVSRHKKIRYTGHIILFLTVAELLVSTQLNMKITVSDNTHKPKHMQKNLALFPEKFPVPANGKVIFNDEKHTSFQPFWRNTQVFSKQVSFKAFSSFELKSYNILDDDFPNLRNAVLNNPLVYLSDSVFPLSQFNDQKINTSTNSKHLYFPDTLFCKLSKINVAATTSDKLTITEFSPSRISIKTSTEKEQFLTLLQTNYPGWKAFVDDVETPIYTSNFNYRSILLPKGNHEVIFSYSNKKLLVLYIFSNAVFFLSILYLIGYGLIKKNISKKNAGLLLISVFLFTGFFLLKRIASTNENSNATDAFNKRWNTQKALYQSFINYENEVEKSDSTVFYSGKKSLKVTAENEFVTLADINLQEEKLKNGTLVVRIKLFAENYPGGLIVSDLSIEDGLNAWHATKIENQVESLNNWNEIIYFRNFFNLDEKGIIRTYLWNVKKTNFRIDDVSVEFHGFTR